MEGKRETLTAEDVGNGVFLAILVACTFFPSLAFQIAPGGEVGDKEEAFATIFLTTLPLSLGLTAILFIWFRGLLESDRQRLAASAGIMLVSGFVGLSFGSSQADQEVFSRVHGPPEVVLLGYAAYILFSYALYYGWPLFIAAALVSFVAGLWLHEKLPE